MKCKVKLVSAPSEADWMGVKRRALLTSGLRPVTPPTDEWKRKILEARHSPIRHLKYSFFFEDIPYWVAMHLRTHVHDTPQGDEFVPYVKTQRNDRQKEYDRGEAPQNHPVNLLIDLSAEQLQVIANKRLCGMAAQETREVVQKMCDLAEEATPQLKGLLVPLCVYCGGVCHEMNGKCAVGRGWDKKCGR